jgi:hypothetical protein
MSRSALEPLPASLRRADHLVAAASAFAFALEELPADLPAIDLPPSTGAGMDQAQIRAVRCPVPRIRTRGGWRDRRGRGSGALARSGGLQLTSARRRRWSNHSGWGVRSARPRRNAKVVLPGCLAQPVVRNPPVTRRTTNSKTG